MPDPFVGNFSFNHVDEELLSPQAVLAMRDWSINKHYAPYLAGKSGEPNHGLVPLDETPEPQLPENWSDEDTQAVVGNITHNLDAETDIIIAQTSDFKQAGELAQKLGYRPVLAGEFLQLLWWLQNIRIACSGWFYCYAERVPQYAVLAHYSCYQMGLRNIIFDTYIGNQIEEGCISANMDTYCIFVRTR